MNSTNQPLILRSLLYVVCLLIFKAAQYAVIVFHLNAALSIAAVAMEQVARTVITIMCSPVARVYLFTMTACIILSAAWTGSKLIYDAMFSWKYCAVWTAGSMLSASSSLPIPVSWNQVQSIVVPISTFVTVTKRSYSGKTIPPEWQRSHRRLLRFALPGCLRMYVLWAAIQFMQPSHVSFPKGILKYDDHARISEQDARHATRAAKQRRCTDFNGQPLSCSDLDRARRFNRIVMPELSAASYREVRTRMSEAGLPGSIWHVGHATPDPNKQSFQDREDFGWNLFCQGARDNVRLGHRRVSCSEASHWGAFHVNCSI